MDIGLHNKAYTSEITSFITSLKKKDPTLESRQAAGRHRLWDRPLDREQLAEFRAARVRQPAYVYQPKGE